MTTAVASAADDVELKAQTGKRAAAFGLTWVAYASYYFGRKGFGVVKSTLEERYGIGVGTLSAIEPEGGSALYRFTLPAGFARFLVEKGSIAVDGVSLTVFDCGRRSFTVSVIPHTASATTLGRMRPGRRVNLETDMLARYVDRAVAHHLRRS